MTQGPEIIPAEDAAARQRVATLLSWERMATRAYSENTRRAWRADWAIFQSFCAKTGGNSLPADPITVREFVLECVRMGKKPATIRRYLATITRAHQAIRELNPCESEPVRLAIQEMKLPTSARQRQARASGRAEIEDFLKNAGEGIRATRERALLLVRP